MTRTKYGAIRTEYHGVMYDSKAEAFRAEELDLLIHAGELLLVERQPVYRLGCPENKYVADFLVIDQFGAYHVEDVKGFETPAFRRNKRLWRAYGEYPLHVLKRVGRTWKTYVIAGKEGK